jgi:hypothetical protein
MIHRLASNNGIGIRIRIGNNNDNSCILEIRFETRFPGHFARI